MNKIYMLPTPTQARQDTSNAIHQIVLKLEQYLPQHGWEITEDRNEADLVAGHAGQTDGRTPVDVAHCHGLYPTQAHPEHLWHWAANAHVLDNIRTAYQVTVPSNWVADILRRDMHIDPAVIGWAIEHEDWAGAENKGYVLWNKTRADSTCDPTPLIELAKRFPHVQFVTTFGENAPANVRVIGRQPYEKMQEFVRGATVYLGTTKETFGIGTLEPMSCGIPVLGYDWGSTAEIVEHGVTGYLVPPSDVDALAEGLEYCLQHRDVLGGNARVAVQQYTWDRVAEEFAATYRVAMSMRPAATAPKVSVVIPCYNYARYLPDAIQSVLHQKTSFPFELIVVDDQSTDDSIEVAQRLLDNVPNAVVAKARENGGPSKARNYGISIAKGQYILCLDADDQLRAGEPVLQTFADALDADRTLGIVYAGLLAIGEDDALIPTNGTWPGPFSFEQQIRGFNQVPTCCMFRKEVWRRAGGYKTRLEPAEDAELWLHMTTLGYRAQQVTSAQWFVYRYHDGSLSNEVRLNKKPEPLWTQPHQGWIMTDQRPMAAPVPPAGKHSNPVRNYDRPEVSVIIPCGPGHERWLSEALDSVQAQTAWNWECIVVFDGDDGGLAAPFWSAYPWVRFLWTGIRSGAGSARNLGAKHARGKFLAFLDADDLLLPDFLEETLRAFRETGRYAYTDWISIGKDGRFETHECPAYDPATLFKRQSIHAVSVLLPKVDFDAVGGFAEDMGAWEDVELYMKLAAAGFCGVRVQRPLLVYRYSTGNMREYGETIKDDLKAYLMRKYGAFIRGEAMCQCNEQLNRELAVPALTEENPDVIRVRMDGPRAPAAPMPIKGDSGQQYARRQKGDVFLILRRDLEGLKHYVSPFQEIAVAAQPVVAPPPPVPLVREGVAQ